MPCQKESWKLNVFYPKVFLLLLIGHTLALVIVFVLLNKKLHSINVSLQLYKWVPTNLCEGGGGGAITLRWISILLRVQQNYSVTLRPNLVSHLDLKTDSTLLVL